MTLRSPRGMGSEGDRRAVESEFVGGGVEVDSDMEMLRERMGLLGKREKQWAEVCDQFEVLGGLFGVRFVQNGVPTPLAWAFAAACVVVPVGTLWALAEWLRAASVAFGGLV